MRGGPALAVLELTSIARGVVVADAMAKRAPVELLHARPVSPGKFVVLVAGEVADVEEAYDAGSRAASDTLIDRLFLPQAHPALAPAIEGAKDPGAIDSVGIVETFSVCASVAAADAALKVAAVELLELRLAVGLGGKAFFLLSGPLPDVEAAIAAGRGALDGGMLVTTEIVAAPHADLVRRRLIF